MSREGTGKPLILRVAMLVSPASRRYVEEASGRDYLTGLHNRLYFDDSLEMEARRAERDGTWLSIALLDVDHFKLINDTYGHAEGDKTLTRVASAMVACARSTDILCRYGGDEFAIIAPSTNPEYMGRTAVARMREKCQQIWVPEGSPSRCVSASVGIAGRQYSYAGGELRDAVQLLREADAALLDAKRNGRNRLVVYRPGMERVLNGG